MKVGIFDSGFGGSSVLRNIISKTHCKSFVYYADRANAPYGLKENLDIYRYTKQGMSFLLDHGAQVAIIACNTATAASCPRIEREYDMPIIGVHPPIFDAIEIYNDNHRSSSTQIPTILVYATAATLGGEHVIQNKHRIEESHKASIELISCSNIVPLIESKKTDSSEFFDILHKTFEPYKERKIDALLFSCTHLPLIDKQIYEVLGYTPEIVLDGSEYVIDKLKQYEEYEKEILGANYKEATDIEVSLHDTKDGSESFDQFANYLNIDVSKIKEI